MMHRFIATIQFVLMASIFSLSISSAEIIQLTDNDYDDTFPKIHNGQVVWGSDDSTDNGIFYWDGTSVQQLINSDIPSVPSYDRYDIHNGHLVWAGYNIHDPREHHIFYWDGISFKSLDSTESMLGGDLYSPKIHNGMVVWVCDYVAIIAWGMEISEGCTVPGQLNHFNPQIHNGQVVYVYGNPTTEIYFWDETSCKNLSNNGYDNKYPQIHNGQVVWQTETENGFEVFYWNGTSVQQLTNNNYDDGYPQIHNGQVVWYGWDGNDYEIFLWEGSGVQQLTDNDYQDYEPMIHNGQMVWTIDDASRNSAQIVYWDGSDVEQLTSDDDTQNRHPQIHDGKVVWDSSDGSDSEIFFWDGIKEGSLTVNIEPESARSAGAKWRIPGGDWSNSGDTQDNLGVGDHWIEFKDIAGWQTPDIASFTITDGQTTTLNGVYTIQKGTLSMTIEPSEVISAGARWRVNGGPWQDSDDMVTGLIDGSYTVKFMDVSGWLTPEVQSIFVVDGENAVTSGVYTESENEGDDAGGGSGGCFIGAMIEK